MRLAILTDTEHSFRRVQAEGLYRMVQQAGADATILYDGLRLLSPARGKVLHSASLSRRVLYLLRNVFYQLACVPRLHPYDIIVVVSGIPGAFVRSRLANIELVLRKLYPGKVVVNYSHYYLPTRGMWQERLQQGDPSRGIPEGGNFGLERYDWYFCASVVSEYPLPRMPHTDHPYSLIGINLDDGSLFPQKKERFLALVDFERADHLHERMIQIRALEETNTDYIVLHGSYSIAEIRELYRQCSIYFVASRESFGLPICELQACGSYILTPYINWCPSHWLKDDLYAEGEGTLSPNFVVYDNDLEKLKQAIVRIKSRYDPEEVFNTFLTSHPHYFYGDIRELRTFLERVRNYQITGQSHLAYQG